MKENEIKAILIELAELLSDGIHIVDVDGVSFVYNAAMEEIEDMPASEVVGKPFSETFGSILEEESTLREAMKNGKKTIELKQTYKNKDGKEITTVNSTVPVILNDKIVGAIEVSKDLTPIKNVTDKMIEYKNNRPKIREYKFEDIITASPSFVSVIEKAKIAAATKASVFIYGETGTGKELLSQSIHFSSARNEKPFLAQNCAALPDSLFEGILFGTSKGGFTGAIDRQGLFEQANGGTLLLDEISAMPYDLQSKLLRVLQEGYIRRVGGTKDMPVDVRIIATVNENPLKLIEEGALRKDLYYRLNIVNLHIPPLRERREDIPLLVKYFLKKHNKELGRRIESISDQALKKLLNYDYSGNVRELENIIMSAVAISENQKVLNSDYIYIDKQRDATTANFDCNEKTLDEFINDLEQKIIRESIKNNKGNISKVANELGIKRQTLQHRIKKYQLDMPKNLHK